MRIVLPVLIALAGLAIMLALRAARSQPASAPAGPKGTLVETAPIKTPQRPIQLYASGTIRPARQVTLVPQISGRIVELHDKLRPGQRIAEGEVIARLDDADYRLAAERATAALEQAQSQLALQEGRHQVAEQEWKFYKDRRDENAQGNRELALGLPQLESAQAGVAQAKAQLSQAQLNLQRTRVVAPFPCAVLTKHVDLGAVVDPRSPIATVVGTEAFWVEASVPLKHLDLIDLPGEGGETGNQNAARATVILDTGESSATFPARILELQPSVSPRGRMAKLLLEAPDPLDQDPAASPLLLNTFVEVRIETKLKPSELLAVPRAALRGQDALYLHRDGKLAIVNPPILWRDPDFAYVQAEALQKGDLAVVSPLANPIEGMALRLRQGDPEGQKAEGEAAL